MGNIADWPATLSPTVTSRHCVGVKYSIHLCMDRHPGAASDDQQYKKNMHGIIQWLCHCPEGIHRSADVRGKQTEAIQWSCSMSIENISDDSGWSSKEGEKRIVTQATVYWNGSPKLRNTAPIQSVRHASDNGATPTTSHTIH